MIGAFAGWDWISDRIRTTADLRPTYDWQAGKYEPFRFEKERFTPLYNILTFTPLPVLSFSDKLVYDIADSRFRENEFSLNYKSKPIYLGNREFTLWWDLKWNHNFINPVVDTLRSNLGVNAQVHRFWTLYLSVRSWNDDIWRYFPEVAEEKGVEPINPFVDLLKSFNFFNAEDRKESYFKMKGISVGFIHDLHDWELMFDYTGTRELSYDGKQYIWDNIFTVSVGLKEVENIKVHTKYNTRR
jgi:hypothetical protein